MKEASKAIQLILETQSNERDQRTAARDCTTFLTKKDGQWEANVLKKMKNKPRYTLDQVTPVVDMIAGQFEKSIFNAKVKPENGGDKDGAKLREGMLRSIQSKSDAHLIYKKAGRKIIEEGFAAWLIDFDYPNEDTFDKEIMIKPIHNAIDRVWIDPYSERQDREDAEWGALIKSISPEEFKARWPKNDPSSIETSNDDYAYTNKRDVLNIAKFYYRKSVDKEIVLLSNGVVLDAEDYEAQKGNLELMGGVTEENRRTRKENKVYCRYLSGTEWLGEEYETPFSHIPIIVAYHGFDIVEDKIIWRRVVEKMMDAQRIYNYAKSREIEEGALAPRTKIMATREQTKGHEQSLKTINVNTDAVQHYNHVNGQNAPYQIGGAQVNPSLVNTYAGAKEDINNISGMYAASMGESVNDQSGKALGILESRSEMSNSSIYKDMEIAITHSTKVILNALGNVYDNMREVALMGEDDSIEVQTINEQTEQGLMNDLSSGAYGVVVEMGATFRTQQEEANQAILQVGQVMPEIIQTSADIILSNIDAPNMSQIQERVRKGMIDGGLIPIDQLNEEEIAKLQQQMAQQQQNQQPDAMTIAAMAEDKKAEADLIEAQIKMASAQVDQFNAETKRIEAMTKAQEAGVKIEGMAIDNSLKTLDAESKMTDITGKQIDNIQKVASSAQNLQNVNN